MNQYANRARTIVAEASGVSRSYDDIKAIDDVSVQIKQGEVLAILGPNGAGKTTLINLLLGRLNPDKGEISLFGHAPRELAARRRTGAMFQVGTVPGTIKVKEHIELFCSYYPDPMAQEAIIEAAGLQGLEDRYFDKLSGGQQQRLLFALAICGNPELVFLDEPTVGMDVEARRLFWSVIRDLVARGSTVVLTTHYLEEADALADRITMHSNGKIAAEGTPETIKSMAGSRIIRCRVNIPPEDLQNLPKVQQVRSNGKRVEIHSAEPEGVLRELLIMDPELNDLIGHTFSVITIKAELANKLLDIDPERARKELKDLENISRDSLSQVREAVSGYRNSDLATELVNARLALEAKDIRFDYSLPEKPVKNIWTGSLPSFCAKLSPISFAFQTPAFVESRW